MTQCPEGCGLCCEQIGLNDVAVEKIFRPALEDLPPADHADHRYLREHLHFLRRADWADLNPQWRDSKHTTLFLCDVFDPVAKRCTDYENRPEMCKRYPFYGREPDYVNDITCVFQGDIGPRRVLPIVAVT